MRFTLLAFAVPLVLGCSAVTTVAFTGTSSSGSGESGSGESGATTGSAGTTTGSAGTGGATTASGTGAGGDTGAGGFHLGTGGGSTGNGGGNSSGEAEVFGQSATTLYKLDPVTKAVTTVGDFQGCDTVIDIALDKDGNMYGTTFGGVYKIDKTTAVCTLIAMGSYPNSLSFVPKGTLDPNVEALVGYLGSIYVRIDTTSGQVTPIGSINGGLSSSGDIVSVIGGGTYLTVIGSDGVNDCNTSDCIIEVDPKTGDLMSFIGKLGFSQVYGVAFWGGSAYGFDNNGQLFEIDLTNGTSTLIPVANPPPSYYGAGSTTSAPLKPPN